VKVVAALAEVLYQPERMPFVTYCNVSEGGIGKYNGIPVEEVQGRLKVYICQRHG
jgi:hypothetical protein